jgi:hypothetical protein
MTTSLRLAPLVRLEPADAYTATGAGRFSSTSGPSSAAAR